MSNNSNIFYAPKHKTLKGTKTLTCIVINYKNLDRFNRSDALNMARKISSLYKKFRIKSISNGCI